MSAMPPLNKNTNNGQSVDYYAAGSSELATETKLTLTRLEPRRRLTQDSTLLVIVLVGLPARGKSFVSRKLQAFLRWSGSQTKIFNVGKYRRQAYAAVAKANKQQQDQEGTPGSCSADFFDASNKEASALRQKVAQVALDDMVRWLDSDTESEDSEDQPHRSKQAKRRNSEASGFAGFADLPSDSRAKDWAKDKVAIFDATNSTAARRQWVLEECTKDRQGKLPLGVVFVESICDDKELLEQNYRFKVNNSPDYVGIPEEEALADLRARVKKYEDQYETITDDSQSYIKIFNLSTKIMVNHIYGRMSKLTVPALMAWHIGTRPVFLCRPGQTPSGVTLDSEDYVASVDKSNQTYLNMSTHSQKRMCRGDKLGPAGKKFRDELYDFVASEGADFLGKRASTIDNQPTGTSMSGLAPLFPEPIDEDCPPFPLRVLASTMRRSAETANFGGHQVHVVEQQSALNPLDKGDFVGMELEELQVENPSWYENLEQEPFHTRFPGGECYRDLIDRLGPTIIDIEQQVIPTLVVSHVSVIQTLIAYFRNTPVENCMSIEVPLHTVFKFTPVRGGGWSESQHPLLSDAESVLPYVTSESEISRLSMDTSNSSIQAQPIWGDHMKFRMTPIAHPSD